MFESMNHVCDEKVRFFLETNIVTTVQTPKRTLTDLLSAFWFKVLTFLLVFDIVNLFISSKRFKGLILNSSNNYKTCLKLWTMFVMKKFGIVSWVLIFLFFLNRIKRDLEDDLEIFLYLKFIFYSFVFFSLSLYPVFSRFCFCRRTCDQKKSSECYCQFWCRIYLQIFDNHNTFQDIIVDERDFTREFNNFFQKTSLSSLDVCHDSKKLRLSTIYILVLLRRQLNFLNLS